MHRYRRKAKYTAWYDDPTDGPSNLPINVKNPFGKLNPRNPAHQHDVESQGDNVIDGHKLTQSRTDEDYPPSSREDRRRELGASTPPHSATTPDAHSKFDEEGVQPMTVQLPRVQSPEMEEMPRKRNTTNYGPDLGSSDTKLGDEARDTGPTDADRQGSHGDGKGVLGILGLSHRSSKAAEDDDNGKNKLEQHFTFMSQIRATVFNSWINALLVASPIGIALNYAPVPPAAVFVVNFIAIVPLAAMLSFATEEIALRTGETIGGLLNATFGNAVELIVSIIALVKGQILIVQTSLIGSMLSNLLLVMGMCFFFGGFNRKEQAFNVTVAQTASSLLFLAVGSLILPTAFRHFRSDGQSKGNDEVSRATAVMLLFVYGCYIFFQLKSHADMFNELGEKNETRDVGGKPVRKAKEIYNTKFRRGSRSVEGAIPESPASSKKDDKEVAQLHIWVAIATLAGSTVLVALNAEFLVGSINAITCDSDSISKNFIGLILLPIVGNAAEHATAVTVAVKDKMDLAIGVAVGSSMQIALLVLPLTVVLGWIIGTQNASAMSLFFDGYQVTLLFVAVILVNYLIQDGKSHWLEGVLLTILYTIIAVTAWYYPVPSNEVDCPGK